MHISIEEHMEDFGSYLYDGLDSVDTLIVWIWYILEYQRPRALDSILTGILARWWVAHHQPYQEW
jgi:hypothetical protein